MLTLYTQYSFCSRIPQKAPCRIPFIYRCCPDWVRFIFVYLTSSPRNTDPHTLPSSSTSSVQSSWNRHNDCNWHRFISRGLLAWHFYFAGARTHGKRCSSPERTRWRRSHPQQRARWVDELASIDFHCYNWYRGQNPLPANGVPIRDRFSCLRSVAKGIHLRLQSNERKRVWFLTRIHP